MMRPFELAFPGPLRDQLVAAVLSGEKVTTAGLLVEYERDGAELPKVGERFAMLDSDGRFLDDPDFTVDDGTMAVAERFRLVECLPQ